MTSRLIAGDSSGDIGNVIVFTRTKHRANRLAEVLERGGVSVARIHGNRSQAQRTEALAGFKSGKYRVLDTISKKYTKNVGYPGFANAAIGEVFDKFLIPEMFARVARGDLTPQPVAGALPTRGEPVAHRVLEERRVATGMPRMRSFSPRSSRRARSSWRSSGRRHRRRPVRPAAAGGVVELADRRRHRARAHDHDRHRGPRRRCRT
jgi:hypothetical protein